MFIYRQKTEYLHNENCLKYEIQTQCIKQNAPKLNQNIEINIYPLKTCWLRTKVVSA